MATLRKCVAEPSGNPSGPPHVARCVWRAAKTPLTGDKIDAPAVCAVAFRPYCLGVVTRTQNVSEYMLVLALCLVYLVAMRLHKLTHKIKNIHKVLTYIKY